MYKALSVIFLLTAAACKTAPPRANAATGGGSANPMSCRIEGLILETAREKAVAGEKNICAGHPCIAKVKILSLSDCGQSVTNLPAGTDTITLRFAYTLDDTHDLFPSMNEQYPGMKPGSRFSALMEQRLSPAGSYFVVYGYKVK